ncbi:DUF2237 family protein [Amaricoccus tamworthensis]|uniref:DUF2237 family protein n=1 Tax=Amaricoccus tamworthensis TaxID=57002 RepID=UPI003C7DDDFA
MQEDRAPSLNVYGDPLKPCGFDPKTGYFRDGCCNTGPMDRGKHVVCVRVTEEFLIYSRLRGNDLITPRPEYGFTGLREGDRWCLCAERWLEAADFGTAPKVILASTHQSALSVIPMELLEEHALTPVR